MFDFQCTNEHMRAAFGRIQHLFDCISQGTVTVVEGDVFDPDTGRYGYRQVLAYIAEHSCNSLGMPLPDMPKTNHGKEDENHGISA